MSSVPLGVASANTSAQQPPAFEHSERLIKAAADLNMATSPANILDRLQLGVSRSAALCLKLDRVDLAAVNGDHVRDAWPHTKPFQTCCLDRASIPAVRRVKGENAGRAPQDARTPRAG
jgi:hypothetical protein